jgi:hypothetical protein
VSRGNLSSPKERAKIKVKKKVNFAGKNPGQTESDSRRKKEFFL